MSSESMFLSIFVSRCSPEFIDFYLWDYVEDAVHHKASKSIRWREWHEESELQLRL
jgi:hypothetical protein